MQLRGTYIEGLIHFPPCPVCQSKNDQAAIKEYLDREWLKKMRRKRDADAGKALRQAAKTGDSEAVRALIDAGVPVDHKGGDYEQTALHYAAREGRTEAVEVLLARGIIDSPAFPLQLSSS